MQFQKEHIAPCGMNCAVCMAFLRKKNSCPGCKSSAINKPKHCISCSIINCSERNDVENDFCYNCSKFPCKRLKNLDKRYRQNYDYSMLDTLSYISTHGIEKHLEDEKVKWKCLDCEGTICIHTGNCTKCGNIKFFHNRTTKKIKFE